MSDRMKKNIHFLNSLYNARTSKEKRKILKGAGPRQLNALAETTKNILKGRIPITPKVKKSLCKHKELVRKLASRKIKNSVKKRLILQKGGFPAIPVILGAISALLPKLIVGKARRSRRKRRR